MTELLLLLIYSVPIAALLYTLINKKYRRHFLVLKIICSTCFLILSFLFAFKGSSMEYYIYFFPAFFMCFLGDVFLGLFNQSKKKHYFIIGTLFFLTGHIFFITACSKIKSLDKYDFIFPIVIILLFPFFIKKKRLTIGKLKPFVYIYAFFISFLFSKCVLMFWNTGTRQTALLAIGSLLFLISDTLILFLYFHRNHRWSTHGIKLATYYYGMFFLALSLLYI